MEQNILKFKAGFYDRHDDTYSICMRGARRWDNKKPLDIYCFGDGDLIDTPISVKPTLTAEIVSQTHFRFQDLHEGCWKDNYDKNVTNYPSLERAMKKVYGEDFDHREIVTILRFRIKH